MSGVRDAHTDERGTGVGFHLRAGWGLSRGVTPMVEVAGHRMFDESLPLHEAAADPVLKTSAVLASVQVELSRAFYVRPGVGFGNHVFAVPDPAAGDEEPLSTGIESGPAAGLALGRTFVVARTVPIAIEGVALWSRGGENTDTRWAAGIQAVVLLRF
jgi:hypothetical protein